ncbi:MAG: hypothetical protein II932_01250 [Treponema sp.]|nr:hypothetical protein [Treponema sp.]
MKRFGICLLLACVCAAAVFAARDKNTTAAAKFDYDFTKINYYVASGVIFDMMVSPEKYAGKTVKINGQFLSDVIDGRRVHAVVLWDMTGCCPSGLNLVPREGMRYPADLPASGNYATFFGTLRMLKLTDDEALCLVVDKWE